MAQHMDSGRNGTMSSSNHPNDTKEDHAGGSQPAQHEQGDTGHSGEGAASAMAHMISRGEQQQRHQTGEADDAAGSNRA
jgi:hypothetical protein